MDDLNPFNYRATPETTNPNGVAPPPACRALFVLHYSFAIVAAALGGSAVYPQLQWARPAVGLGILIVFTSLFFPVAISVVAWRNRVSKTQMVLATVCAVVVSIFQHIAMLPHFQ